MAASRSKVEYQKELSSFPADCLMPKFEIPCLSADFSLDSQIQKMSADSFVTDACLGVPIEFADLAIYSIPAKEDDITETDLRYIPDLGESALHLTVPTAQVVARPTSGRPFVRMRHCERLICEPTLDLSADRMDCAILG
jgi:hypothetical protein